MLPARSRMRASDKFVYTIRRGRRSGNKHLVVYAAYAQRHAPVADLPQVGFVVSKAVGNSVVRHRVVRQLRHCMREFLADLEADFIVVRALRPLTECSSAQMSDLLSRELTRLGALRVRDILVAHEGDGDEAERLSPSSR